MNFNLDPKNGQKINNVNIFGENIAWYEILKNFITHIIGNSAGLLND